jgi:hypothetical protein
MITLVNREMAMRFGVLLAGLLMAAPANAVTFTGVLNPTDGFATFNFPWEWGEAFNFDAGKTQVSFSLSGGVIYEAHVETWGQFWYDIIPSDPRQAPWGSDGSWTEGCFYNSPVGDGCYYSDQNFPAEKYPSDHVSDFKVGQKSLSYTVTAPPSYDNCDQPIFDEPCRFLWTFRPEYAEVKVASHNPVSWSLSFKNVAGAVPEPSSWAMMIAGMGLIGASLRKRRSVATV